MSIIAGNTVIEAGEGTDRIRGLGLIVNVIVEELKKDWKETLRQVAEIGYDYLEFRGYYGDDIAYFKKFMQEIGLKPLAAGDSIEQLKKEDVLKRMIDESLYLGKKYLICYKLDAGAYKTADDFKKAAADLNAIGEKVTRAGLCFAFHNHDKEFVPVQDHLSGYDLLVQETDSQRVALLLDIYWAIKGGADPLILLQRYPERFELFHVKDMDKTPEQLFTCPGNGIIDFPRIFAQAKKTNVQYYTVEVDKASDPFQCIQDSYTYLKQLRF
ncbi:MAG: sugar phosphate isomerase/epimerase [Flavisolibacter sp.]|nr:sugar phosphate isomerase/epimerase [Flavisolibacter sp.]